MLCSGSILADFMLAQASRPLSASSRSLAYSFWVSGAYGAFEELAEEVFAVGAELAGVARGLADLLEDELELVEELVFVLAGHGSSIMCT